MRLPWLWRRLLRVVVAHFLLLLLSSRFLFFGARHFHVFERLHGAVGGGRGSEGALTARRGAGAGAGACVTRLRLICMSCRRLLVENFLRCRLACLEPACLAGDGAGRLSQNINIGSKVLRKQLNQVNCFLQVGFMSPKIINFILKFPQAHDLQICIEEGFS